MLADQGTQVTIDEDKAIEVLNLMRSSPTSGLMPKALDYQGAVALFANGDAGLYFQGEWEISTFQTAKMPFSDGALPERVRRQRQYAVQADTHTLVLPKQPTDDPDAAEARR